MNKIYPIIICTFDRLDKIKTLIDSLNNNLLSTESDLFIFSDQGKNFFSKFKVYLVRRYLKKISGFKSTNIIHRKYNYGMAKNIINGIDYVINLKYDAFIYLDDDLTLSPYFLKYMNLALSFYNKKKRVMHIAGYFFPITQIANKNFFMKLTLSWGWGSWKRVWLSYKKDPNYFIKRFNNKKIHNFNYDGTYNFWQQILNNKSKVRNTYSIFLYTNLFLKNGLSLTPGRSLVFNNGADGSGVHVKKTKIYDTKIYKFKPNFTFPKIIKEDIRNRNYIKKYFLKIK
jgi:hypothetical protein